MDNHKLIGKKARKMLFQLGCAGATKAVLNNEFGNSNKVAEKATGPLCGGIMQEGHQCGMLWGASLAVGAEAWRKTNNKNESIKLAIETSKVLVESFTQRTKSTDCRVITKCNQRSLLGMLKYFVTGKPLSCARLISRWVPEAVQTAKESLAKVPEDSSTPIVSCASFVAEKMGASKEETMMVAGFAGGIGLSGNACGALGAVIYFKSLERQRNNPGDTTFKIPEGQKVLKAFLKESNSEVLCHKLCGKRFSSVGEHSDFIQNGGCNNLLEVLAGE